MLILEVLSSISSAVFICELGWVCAACDYVFMSVEILMQVCLSTYVYTCPDARGQLCYDFLGWLSTLFWRQGLELGPEARPASQ